MIHVSASHDHVPKQKTQNDVKHTHTKRERERERERERVREREDMVVLEVQTSLGISVVSHTTKGVWLNCFNAELSRKR